MPPGEGDALRGRRCPQGTEWAEIQRGKGTGKPGRVSASESLLLLEFFIRQLKIVSLLPFAALNAAFCLIQTRRPRLNYHLLIVMSSHTGKFSSNKRLIEFFSQEIKDYFLQKKSTFRCETERRVDTIFD